MSLDEKINLNKIEKILINPFVFFWKKFHMLLFFAILFSLVIIGWRIWEKSIYSYKWDENKKNEFINSQDKAVILKEDDYKKILEDISLRKNQEKENITEVRDIFKSF